MALVKFYRGLEKTYKDNLSKYTNGIFFATDKLLIYLNGLPYGVDSAVANKLGGVIDNVTWSESIPNTITFTTVAGDVETNVTIPNATSTLSGFMSKDDKVDLDTLKGGASVEGSVLKQVADAKTAVIGTDSDTVASNTIKGVKNYADSLNTAMDGRVTALQNAIGDGGSVEDKITEKINALDVIDEAKSDKYVSGVSETDGKITVTRANLIASDDTVLSTNDSGSLKVTLGLNYNEATQEIQLTDKSGGVIGTTIDARKFITDGMLSSADLVTDPDATHTGTFIKLVFNADAGKQTIYVDVTSLIDVYTAGNGLSLTDNKFAIKLTNADEKFLEVTAGGLASKGILDAINTAKTLATTEIVEKSTGNILITRDTDSGHNVYTIKGNDIASAATLTTVSNKANANETAINTLKGTGEGSVTKTVNDAVKTAKDTIDNYTINGYKISSDPSIVLNGRDLTLGDYTTSQGSSISSSDTITAAIKKLDDALLWYDEE